MNGLSLVTKGMLCYGNIEIINRYVLPINLQVKETETINLEVVDISKININLTVEDKSVNLKLSDNNINVKEQDKNINIDL